MERRRSGLLAATGAYLLWGVFPLYWTLMGPASALEVLAHRVLWSLLVVALLVGVSRRWVTVVAAFRDRRRCAALALAAAVIAVNWGGYIWGVSHHHVVETSLGYFINPIVTVVLGVVVLREQLRPVQWLAVGLAGGAVVVLGVGYGRPPWLALMLAASFGLYGLIKKTVGVGAVEGLAVETATLAPLALAYLLLTTGTFTTHGVGHAALLASSGVATAVPLLLFAAAASRLPMYVLGVLQYLAPTLQFAIGVGLRHEPMPLLRALGFVLVWTGLAVFSLDTVRARRRVLAEVV